MLIKITMQTYNLLTHNRNAFLKSKMAAFLFSLASVDRNRTDTILVDINRFYVMT